MWWMIASGWKGGRPTDSADRQSLSLTRSIEALVDDERANA